MTYSKQQKSQSLIEDFTKAEKHWKLDELYAKLSLAKQEFTGNQTDKLNITEKACLRGFLCGYSPQEVATRINRSCQGLRVELSRGLYRYVENLTKQRLKDWKKIGVLLDSYRLPQNQDEPILSPPPSPPFKEKNGGRRLGEASYIDQYLNLSNFYGRSTEIATLSNWLLKENCRLVAIVGIEGIGKTSIVANLVNLVKNEFDCLVWLRLNFAANPLQVVADLNQVFSQYLVCNLLPKNLSSLFIQYPKNFARSQIAFRRQFEIINPFDNEDFMLEEIPTIPIDSTCQLIKYLQAYKCLIVWDDFQSVFASHKLAGNYLTNYQEYSNILQQIGTIAHQSCVLLISTDKPKEIALLEGDLLPVRSLKLVGMTEEASQILQDKGLTEVERYADLISIYDGHPLALKIAATTIQTVYMGSISKFLDEGIFLGELSDKISEYLERLSNVEKQVLSYLLEVSEPLMLSDSIQNFGPTMSNLISVLESLINRSLVETQLVNDAIGIKINPLIKQYLLRSH